MLCVECGKARDCEQLRERRRDNLHEKAISRGNALLMRVVSPAGLTITSEACGSSGESRQLMRDLFFQDVFDGQGGDGLAGLLEEGADFAQCVVAVTESYEEALLAVLAHHHGLEGVDIGPADFVLLLDVDWVSMRLSNRVLLLLDPVLLRG